MYLIYFKYITKLHTRNWLEKLEL